MTPEQATFLADQYVTTMQREVPTTLKVLKAVPDSAWSYRPDDKSRTAGELARHIAQSDVWFVEGVINGAYVFDKAKSEALLAKLWQHATQDKLKWTHDWAVGDLILWDNRCTMHQRTTIDHTQPRVMHRALIKGEPVISAWKPVAAA